MIPFENSTLGSPTIREQGTASFWDYYELLTLKPCLPLSNGKHNFYSWQYGRRLHQTIGRRCHTLSCNACDVPGFCLYIRMYGCSYLVHRQTLCFFFFTYHLINKSFSFVSALVLIAPTATYTLATRVN